MFRLRIFLLTLLLLILAGTASQLAAATTPTLMTYQGSLSTSAGAPANGNYAIVFTIYDDATGVGPIHIIWQEVHSSVIVQNGLFSVILGAGSPPVPLNAEVYSTSDRWLGIKIGADPEIAPRSRLTTVPYSQRVETIDRARGGIISGTVVIAPTAKEDDAGPASLLIIPTPGDTVFKVSPPEEALLKSGFKIEGCLRANAPDSALVVRSTGSSGIYSVAADITNSGNADQLMAVQGAVENNGGGTAAAGRFYTSGTGNGTQIAVNGEGYSSGTNPAYGFLGQAWNAGRGNALGGKFTAENGGFGKHIGAMASSTSDNDSTCLGAQIEATGSGTGRVNALYVQGNHSGSGELRGARIEALSSSSDDSYGLDLYANSVSGAATTGIMCLTINTESGPTFAGDFMTNNEGTGSHTGLRSRSYGAGTNEVYGLQSMALNTSSGFVLGGKFEAYNNGGDCIGVSIHANGNSAIGAGYGMTVVGINDGSGLAIGGSFYTPAEGTGNHVAVEATSAGAASYARSFQGTTNSEGSCTAQGINVNAQAQGTGQAYGVSCSGYSYSSGTVYGMRSSASSAGSGTIYGGYFTTFGSSGSGTQYGVYGITAPASGYAGYFSGDVRITDSLIVLGGKSAAVPMDNGEYRLLYSQESPEVWFEDFGEARLVNGHVHVELDPLFLQTVTVNTKFPLKVFVQLQDDCNGTYVKTSADGFDVYELKSGRSNAAFSYRVVAKRKGFENLRLAKMSGPTPAEVRAQERANQDADAQLKAASAADQKLTESSRARITSSAEPEGRKR